MEEFFKKYGVKSEHQFFSHVSADPIFAMRVASDYFEDKFPRKVVEEKVIMHPDHPDADPPRLHKSQDELIAENQAEGADAEETHE